MSAAVLGWIACAFALAIAGALFARLRSAEAGRSAAAAELAARSAELESTQKRLEQRSAELRARGEELSELRKKHDKLKRRAGDEREEEKSAPARIRALETDLAAERADSRAARDEIVRLHGEAERSAAELARVGAELAAASQKLREVTPLADAGQLDALKARVQAGEERAAKLAAELATAQQNTTKYKGRWETLDKTYIVLRGELELKKDELRSLRVEVERLRALEVVLVEPEPRPAEPPA